MTDFIGTQENGVYRFNIAMNMLDVGKLSINEKNQIIIPIKHSDDNSFEYDEMFNVFAKKEINPKYDQESNLEIIYDNQDMSCFIGANIKIKNGGTDTYHIEKITLNEQEEGIIRLSVLKVLNHYQYTKEKTRLQVTSKLKENIENDQLGFVMDDLSNNIYSSFWASLKDGKALLACVLNPDDNNSEIQIQKWKTV